jgi:hypothetical protein
MGKAIKAILSGKAVYRAPKASHLIHKGEHSVHIMYFAGVAIEGHGFYRIAAAVLFILALAALFVAEGGMEEVA